MSRRKTIGLILLGAVISIALMGYFRKQNEPPLLTPQRLAEGRARWKARALKDYHLHVVVGGATQADYTIEVRSGEVTEMKNAGEPVPASAAAYWTVPGMFDFLELELKQNPDAYLDARFDSEWGYPAYFRRQHFGTKNNIEWTVRDFVPFTNPEAGG